MTKSNGEFGPHFGNPFGLHEDKDGHIHSISDHGTDHDWGEHPFDEEAPTEQFPTTPEEAQPAGPAEDKSANDNKE